MADVRRALIEDTFEITGEPDIMQGARLAFERMLAVPRDNLIRNICNLGLALAASN